MPITRSPAFDSIVPNAALAILFTVESHERRLPQPPFGLWDGPRTPNHTLPGCYGPLLSRSALRTPITRFMRVRRIPEPPVRAPPPLLLHQVYTYIYRTRATTAPLHTIAHIPICMRIYVNVLVHYILNFYRVTRRVGQLLGRIWRHDRRSCVLCATLRKWLQYSDPRPENQCLLLAVL